MTVEELRKILARRPLTDEVWIFSSEAGVMVQLTDVDDSRSRITWLNARAEQEGI